MPICTISSVGRDVRRKQHGPAEREGELARRRIRSSLCGMPGFGAAAVPPSCAVPTDTPIATVTASTTIRPTISPKSCPGVSRPINRSTTAGEQQADPHLLDRIDRDLRPGGVGVQPGVAVVAQQQHQRQQHVEPAAGGAAW